MRSRMPILPLSIHPISSPNGNGTASACRLSPAATKGAACRRGSIRERARTSKLSDLLPSLHLPGAIDGELLVLRDGRCRPSTCCSSLNRKVVSPKLMKDFPIHLRAYDLLGDDENDLRELPLSNAAGISRLSSGSSAICASTCRRRLPSIVGRRSPRARRSRQRRRGRGRRSRRGRDVEAARCALSAWKAQGPMVEMEARSAHHRRCADVCAARSQQALVLLFGLHFCVWTHGDDGEQLVPVGRAYFGFTDEELLQIDRFVRRNTTEKFGPVRHVVHEPDQGLVLEVLRGLARSPRQIRRRDAVSAHQPAALGQAAARGRPAGDARADAER